MITHNPDTMVESKSMEDISSGSASTAALTTEEESSFLAADQDMEDVLYKTETDLKNEYNGKSNI